MGADQIFVAHNDQLQQLPLPSEDRVTNRLQKWSVQQLRTWLGLRGVRSGDALKEDLVRIAFFTWKLDLPVNPDEVSTQRDASKRLDDLLNKDSVRLPDPTTVTDWVDDLRELPTVTYADIYSYLITTPGVSAENLKAYKSLESYNYAVNGWVQDLKIHRPSADIAFIKAKVRPSQHSTAPYDAWVMVRGDGRIEAARCCCTAGLGEVCSHVGAILFKMMGAAELGLNQPDACTSKACEWNQAFCKQVQPERIECIDFTKPRLNKVRKRARPTRKCSRSSSSSSNEGEFWDIVCEAAPTSVALHILSPPNLTSDAFTIDDVDCEISVFDSDPTTTLPADINHIVESSMNSADLYEKICTSVSADQSQLLLNLTTGQSADSLWHQVREKRITSSKMGDVINFMNSSRKRPSKSLMNTILGVSKSLDHVPAIKWGRENEEEARQDYLDEIGDAHALLTVKRCGIKIPAGDAHLGASTDGYVTCDCCDDRVLEVKCPYTAANRGLKPLGGVKDGCITFLDENCHLKRDHAYFVQVQAQMALLQVKTCDFVVWTPKGINVESIPFDAVFWNTTKASLDRFYIGHVIPALSGVRDPMVLTDSTSSISCNQASLPDGRDDTGVPPKKRRRGPKHPCTVCQKGAGTQCVGCDGCDQWTHFKCAGLDGTEDFLLASDWFCKNCRG